LIFSSLSIAPTWSSPHVLGMVRLALQYNFPFALFHLFAALSVPAADHFPFYICLFPLSFFNPLENVSQLGCWPTYTPCGMTPDFVRDVAFPPPLNFPPV